LDVAKKAEANGALHGTRLKTASDVAFATAHSFDFGPSGDRERNPYRLLNSALYKRDAMQLGRVRGLLFGLLSALRSLPRFSAHVLYRGIRERVALDTAHYHEGNTATWHSFSSTTTDLAVTKTFLTDTATGKCEGTLFIVHNACGYKLQPLSFFNEHEILLEPEIRLRVVSVLDAPLIVVDMEMVPGASSRAAHPTFTIATTCCKPAPASACAVHNPNIDRSSCGTVNFEAEKQNGI